MNVFTRTKPYIGLILAIGVFVLPGVAHAAPEVLSMTPSASRPAIEPGATISGSFQVVNQGKTGYRIRIYAAPYSVKSEDYTPDFTPLPSKPNIATWLQFSTTGAAVQPNQTLTVHYTLSAPANTQPGGYYAVAFAETQPSGPTQGVVVNEQVGEIFYIDVLGPVKQSGKMLSWSSPFFQKPPLNATLRLENDGGLHYASNIQLVVRDIFGRPKYTLTTQKEILPQTIRRIPVSWSGAPGLGLFKVNGTATILGKTVKLPTKYVIVMSNFVRKICLIVIATLAILLIMGFVLRRQQQPRKLRTGKDKRLNRKSRRVRK